MTPILELYQWVGCINSILNISTWPNSVVLQYGFNALLDYPVVSFDFPRNSSYDLCVADLRSTTVGTFLNESSNPHARYVLIVDEVDDGDVAELLERYFINVVFLVAGDIYTVFPYKTGSFREFSTDVERIGRCRDGRLDFFDPHRSLFPDKLPPVWKSTELTLIYNYEAPYSMATEGQKKGIEMDLLELVFEKIGMDPVYVEMNTDSKRKLAKEGRYDINFGNQAVNVVPVDDFTMPYSCDSAYWYVPQPDAIPKWKLAFKVLSMEVNVALSLSIFCLCVLWELSHFLMEGRRFGGTFPDKSWRIATVFLEQGVRWKIDYATQGIIFFLLLQSFLILNCLFKAKYTFFLSGTNYERTIETLEEAIDEGLKIGSTKFLIDVYLTNPQVSGYIQKNFVECDTGPACLTRSAELGDLAVLKPYRKVAYIRDAFTDDRGHHLHHRLATPVITRCNCFYLRKGHPLRPLIDRYVHHLMQHGFVKKVIEKYDQMTWGRGASTASGNARVRFDAVKGPVVMVAIGNFIGAVVFAVEKVMDVRNRRLGETQVLI